MVSRNEDIEISGYDEEIAISNVLHCSTNEKINPRIRCHQNLNVKVSNVLVMRGEAL